FLERERNESREIYYPCEECGGSCGNTVYITSHGNRYHATLSCSKLKRTVLAVPISQVGGRGACSKCGN
ncbi:MAG: pilus assembly protein, partial [Lachnospiraceae bacterium]|nr:pilus assembly protein [Lachnospiraceae bacterium]